MTKPFRNVMHAFSTPPRGIALWTLILAGAALGGAAVTFAVIYFVNLRLVLANQAAEVTVVEPMKVTARVLDNLDIELNDTIRTKVPIDQTISIPLKDTLKVMAEFEGDVPIKMNVKVRDTILLEQELYVDAVIDAQFLGEWHKLPIKGKVPVKARVPVNLTIPVDQPIRLKLKAPVKVTIQQDVVVPFKTEIEADIPIQSAMSVPVKSDLVAEVDFPKEPTALVINYADLRLPLRTLALDFADDEVPAK